MRKTNENIRDFRASRTDAEPIARKIKYGGPALPFWGKVQNANSIFFAFAGQGPFGMHKTVPL
ncbi:MAG: hypothetical protein U0N53_03865 [Ruthenibacterium sp.]|nr:hypothetical protein [Ruthenibacterium sp.]